MNAIPLISIIDDDESVRLALSSLLRSYSYNVMLYDSAISFLNEFEGTDCLITDVQMPGTSGIELQDQLNQAGVSFPIIFITAFPEESIRQKALASGAFCFMSKPFNSEKIIDCVETALKLRAI